MSGMAEAEKRWARGGYRAAFPAQGQSNPSKSLAGWLCSLSSSQSPASGPLAMCLPLGRTTARIWGSKKALALGKCCSQEPHSTHFLLKWKAVFSRPLVSEAKWRTSHLSQGIPLHFSSDFNKNLDDKSMQSSASNLELKMRHNSKGPETELYNYRFSRNELLITVFFMIREHSPM